MNHIKVSELFYSIQGEGRYMGVPSIFLRTFGCNFTCDGFGLDKGQKSEERHKVDPSKYKSYKELPLVSTGCDSYASWDVRFKKLSPKIDIEELGKKIHLLKPNGKWGDVHLVITGGEPLLGWQRAYPRLLAQPSMSDLKEITFETNGTQTITPELKDYLQVWEWAVPGRQVTFSVSAKLSVSGESRENAILPEIVASYQEVGYTYLKFVIATEEDANEALEVIKMYRAADFTGPVYLMPVGGVESVYAMNNRAVAELAMKHGLRYSDRLQLPLFRNAWGT